MTDFERERLVARVCSGSVKVLIEGRPYYLRRPGRDSLYGACELYDEVFRESQLDGLLDEVGVVQFLVSHQFWTDKDQADFELLPKQMEDAKVALYQATFQSNKRDVIRKALKLAKAEYARLYAIRHSYDHLTCEGTAAMARARYLTAMSLTRPNGTRVYTEDEYWDDRSDLVDSAMAALSELRLTEEQFRELARTDPWRTVWSGAKVEGSLFGYPPPDWTDEQRSLANWSMLYDSVNACPERPPEHVIDDDDMLDGWLILQRRNSGQATSDPVSNEKIKNSGEVFLPADTGEDAKRVMAMNDPHARAVQKQRFDHLRSKGQVNELDMPDTAQRLRTEITNKLMASVRK